MLSALSWKRAAVRPARFFVLGLVLLSLAAPPWAGPVESAGNSPHRQLLPLVQSFPAAPVSWSTPFLIDPTVPPGRSQAYPLVELDDAGNAYVTWSGYPGPPIHFAVKPAGAAAWSSPQPVVDTGRDQHLAATAIDPAGNFYILWIEEGGAFVTRRSPGGEWSPPEAVPTPHGADFFRLAADRLGRLHLLFRVYQGDYEDPIDLFYMRREAAGEWQAPLRVNDRPGSLARPNGPSAMPSLAVDGQGLAHAAWREWHTYEWRIYYARQLPDGGWSRNEVVDPTSTAQEGASLAADAAGNVYLAWADDREARASQVRFAFRPARGAWQPSVAINETAGMGRDWYEMEGPSLTVDGSGAVYVIWPILSGDTGTLVFDWRPPVDGDASASGAWHADQPLSHNDQVFHRQGYDLAANARGQVLAGWMQFFPVPGTGESLPKIMVSTRP